MVEIVSHGGNIVDPFYETGSIAELAPAALEYLRTTKSGGTGKSISILRTFSQEKEAKLEPVGLLSFDDMRELETSDDNAPVLEFLTQVLRLAPIPGVHLW